MLKPPLKTIDLFAGVGGIRLGFEEAGFSSVYANDIDDKCKITYDLNSKTTKLTLKDISKRSHREYSSVLDDILQLDYDVLLGGFPCQAFSIAGYRQGFQDSKGRGDLFFYIAEIIEKTRPKAFLLENVKNLKNHDNNKTYEIIKETLTSLGYSVQERVMNSMEYGDVPQNRERIYIVGFQSDKYARQFQFPEKIKLETGIKDVLETNVDEYFFYDNKPLWNKISEFPFKENVVYQWRRKYIRENKSNVCPTLTANMGTGGHNVPIIFDGKRVRKLTPRECFRMQGFSDDFKLPDTISRSSLYKQAGNSVSVPVIRRIAQEMKKAMDL